VEITLLDKLKMRLMIYCQLHRMPSIKDALRTFINPIDSTRDIEFSYLIKFLQKNNIKPENVLDISSPFVMAYVLSAKGKVIKTDINPDEREMIKESHNLRFKLEDGTKLSFADNTFDLVYSISVIEHIYQKYAEAVIEMIRVLKPGGYLYLTFPVAAQHVEEWQDQKAYPTQYQNDGKAFFQYRFDNNDVGRILAELKDIDVMDRSIYCERSDGEYDRVMKKLHKTPKIGKLTSVRKGLINFWSSFSLLESCPNSIEQTKSFGNLSLMLKKRK
jgi:ubiquinone/menaquinone biosynthesis C-methylase UbiE